jgi:serine protease Do
VAGRPAPGFRDTGPSASWGLVSDLRCRVPPPPSTDQFDRHSHWLHHYPTLVQIDSRLAPISGAAVLNLDGELVAVTTTLGAIEGGDTPSAFAVPLNPQMQRIIEVLRKGEEVEYGFLGVGMNANDRDTDGVVLSKIEKGSPADRAGMRDGDVLLSVDGVRVRTSDEVTVQVGTRLAGTTIKAEVRTRGETARTCNVTLARFYVDGPSIASKRPAARRGLRVDYSSVLKGRAGTAWINGVPEGVLIREVLPKSPADHAKLQVDKIITRVNGTRVLTPAEFYREMDRATGRVELHLLNEARGEESVTVEAK